MEGCSLRIGHLQGLQSVLRLMAGQEFLNQQESRRTVQRWHYAAGVVIAEFLLFSHHKAGS